MTLTVAQRGAVQQQVRPRASTVHGTTRRFTVWLGSSIGAQYTRFVQIADKAISLRPTGAWDETEVLIKAGEGGSWQSTFDPHPLAIGGPVDLAERWNEAFLAGVRLTPYVVVRARSAWIAGEQEMIRQCVQIAGRCVLNVEPGAAYYNGPNDPGFIRGYLAGCGVPADALEVCMIPRAQQVAELGGVACLQAWTDPQYVGSASFECYGISAPGTGATSLQVDVAIPRLDGWGVPAGWQYRIAVVQRDERARWADTPWCAHGMQVWSLDSN